MDCLDHQQGRSRRFKQGRRYHHPPDDKDESDHHTYGKPLYDSVRGRHQRPRGCEHVNGRPSLETLISEAHSQTKSSHYQRLHNSASARSSQTSGHRAVSTAKKRSKSEHAVGKGIRTGAEVAFRIRNDRGSWVGEKGIKVASAAIASATIDFMLGADPKKHSLAHIAVSMVEGVVTDGITNG
ncbi:hypothetical protein FVEN_g12224 [Fusarium venenatum]|uniref:Uncharacterized protein n=1 Tax=Fusarium venenatum TaxID=56646 RepID=A0A2L2TSA8_9HYPO|nr:uncharacterized protein FVRRES_08254 [Fusarium venenatum]KAG8349567.1 hypothetical protein FVEN_g12224 [Fusarium venenatum]CEI68177.1 unnamed protein product [Fusarium venenatum]